MKSLEKLVFELQESKIFLIQNEEKLNRLDRFLRIYDCVPIYCNDGIIKKVKGCIGFFPKKVFKELCLDEKKDFKQLCDYIMIYNKRKIGYGSRTYLLNVVKKISKPRELLNNYINSWMNSVKNHQINLG